MAYQSKRPKNKTYRGGSRVTKVRRGDKVAASSSGKSRRGSPRTSGRAGRAGK